MNALISDWERHLACGVLALVLSGWLIGIIVLEPEEGDSYLLAVAYGAAVFACGWLLSASSQNWIARILLLAVFPLHTVLAYELLDGLPLWLGTLVYWLSLPMCMAIAWMAVSRIEWNPVSFPLRRNTPR